MGVLGRVRKKIGDSYLVWRYVKNRKASSLYRRGGNKLNDVQRKILTDLNKNGIAITHVDELLPDTNIYKALQAYTSELEGHKRDAIESARKEADKISDKKDFLMQLLGDVPDMNPNDISVRFALQKEIMDIVNGYFGCLTKLKFFNIWHTFVTHSGPKRSMLWHKDPEDKWIIKVFLYLSDVDEDAGPFVYAPGTHPKGSVKQKPEWFKEPGRGAERSTDEQMEKIVPRERWIKALGKRGTLIFAETKGYHKGGLATKNERIMYNCLFVSPASKTKEVFTRNDPSDFNSFSLEQRFALIR